jgi:hypothetical protein
VGGICYSAPGTEQDQKLPVGPTRKLLGRQPLTFGPPARCQDRSLRRAALPYFPLVRRRGHQGTASRTKTLRLLPRTSARAPERRRSGGASWARDMRGRPAVPPIVPGDPRVASR